MSASIFEAFATRQQFIIYRLSEKTPVHPESLHAIDGQDSANWLLPNVARAWAAYLNGAHGANSYGVGIVLYDGCGVACIDIDKALVNGESSPLAVQLCNQFAGAYQEVSQGQLGIHIFFSYSGSFPAHKRKNVQKHVELYHEKRFIGLTGEIRRRRT